MHLQFIFVCFRLSIKWLKRAEQNKQTFLPPLQREVGATRCTRRDCEKIAWTSSPSRFWCFSSFARGQYHRTAPTHKIRNLSHFLKVYQRVELYNLAFSTRWCIQIIFVCLFFNLMLYIYLLYDIIDVYNYINLYKYSGGFYYVFGLL